jgi:hypothetical protein
MPTANLFVLLNDIQKNRPAFEHVLTFKNSLRYIVVASQILWLAISVAFKIESLRQYSS